MRKIIEDTSSDELLSASESNMAAFYSAYGRANGNTLAVGKNVTWFYTGIQDSLFNGVISARFQPDEAREVFNKLQAKIDEQGAPALWWIGPLSKPAEFGPLLEGYGLQLDGEVPGMAVDLISLDKQPETIMNFIVQKVDSAELQELWARTAAVGTGLSDAATEEMVRLEATLADPKYKAQHRYIGSLNGTPVATSALILDSGVAGIYAVATMKEARGKGIGRFLTVMPLLEARQLGYRVGILQSSSMGYPIYKKIGFKEVSKYKIYLQSKKEQ